MNAKRTLKALLSYYSATGCALHDRVAVEGVDANRDNLLAVVNNEEAARTEKKKGTTHVALVEELEAALAGKNRPLVFSNASLLRIFGESYKLISNLENRLAQSEAQAQAAQTARERSMFVRGHSSVPIEPGDARRFAPLFCDLRATEPEVENYARVMQAVLDDYIDLAHRSRNKDLVRSVHNFVICPSKDYIVFDVLLMPSESQSVVEWDKKNGVEKPEWEEGEPRFRGERGRFWKRRHPFYLTEAFAQVNAYEFIHAVLSYPRSVEGFSYQGQ